MARSLTRPGDRKAQARPSRVPGRKSWTVLAVVFVYFAVGYGFAWHACPAGSFEISNQATVLFLLAAVGAACGLGFAMVQRAVPATLTAGVGHAQIQQAGLIIRKPLLLLLIAAAAAVAAAAWANCFLRYACFAPDRIYLHTEPFGAVRVAGWNQVTLVGARCWTRKGSRQVALVFRLDTGDQLSMELTHDGTTFRGVSTALQGQPARYALSASVTDDNCPADVYPALQRWGR